MSASLYDRALASTLRTILSMFWTNDVAVEALRRADLLRPADPTVNHILVGLQTDHVIGVVDRAAVRNRKKIGRPPMDFFRALLLVAAFDTAKIPGRTKREARALAARRLGGDVTMDIVQKAGPAFENHIRRIFSYLDEDQVRHQRSVVITMAKVTLDACEAENRTAQAERRTSRFAPPICFGATDDPTLARSSNGAA